MKLINQFLLQKFNLIILLFGIALTIVLLNSYIAFAQTSNTAQDSIQRAAWSSNVNISFSENSFTFQSDGLPSHGSLDAYVVPNGSFVNGVTGYSAEHTIPLNPVLAATPTPTSLGVIGVAVSGAVFFNAYEGNGEYALESNYDVDGIPFIDSCNGHPLPNGSTYHYHGIPYCISDAIDVAGQHSRLVGYMQDGFPIYGPQDANGAAPTDLDECNSHFGPTPEYPHYHTTEAAPYMVNCYVGEIDMTMLSRGPGPGGPQGGRPAPPPQGGQPQGGGPQGGGPQGGPPRPDFSQAATALDVSVDELMAALGGPPPDLVGAAQRLGVTVEKLMQVLPPPPGGGPPQGGRPPPPPGQ